MGVASGAVTMFLDVFGGGVINLGTAVETGSAYIETKAMDFGEDSFVKFIDKVLHNIRGLNTSPYLSLEIYGSDDEEGPFTLFDTIVLSQNDPVYSDPPGQRFFKFRFTDAVVSTRWSLHGFSVFGEPGGDEF